MAPLGKRLKCDAGFKLKVVYCDDMPDETVDNDWYVNADMLEFFNSNSEDKEKIIIKLYSLCKSTQISWLYFFSQKFDLYPGIYC